MDKTLITTSGLQEVKIAEGELINNLILHANSTLSKAHGWEFINLPHPFLDADGNDVSFYADSHGDVVGTELLRLSHNGINYYAPLNSSVLAGQAPATGITPSSQSQLATSNNSAWITNLSPQYAQNLHTTNDAVLLPHTRRGHWEAHTANIYAVVPLVIKDSAGHTVSNYVARISYQGQELWIPCEPRLGGPVQPIRLPFLAIATDQLINYNSGEMADPDGQFLHFWSRTPLGGTLPYTITWQLNTYQPLEAGSSNYFWTDPAIGSGTWVDLPYTTTVKPFPGGTVLPNFTSCYYAMTPPNKLTLQVSADLDNMRVAATVRALYTNAAGPVQSNWGLFLARKSESSWVVFSGDTNQAAYYVDFTNNPDYVDGYYVST